MNYYEDDYYFDKMAMEEERTFIKRRDYLYKSNAYVETKYFELGVHEKSAAVLFKTTYGLAILFGTKEELLVFKEDERRGINDIRSLLDSICFGRNKHIFEYLTDQALFYGDKKYLNFNIFEGKITVDDASYTFFTSSVANSTSNGGDSEVHNAFKNLFKEGLTFIRKSNPKIKTGYDFKSTYTVDELIAYKIVDIEATIS